MKPFGSKREKGPLNYLKLIHVHSLKMREYYQESTKEEFNSEGKDFDAICMQIIQIGESISKLQALKDNIPANRSQLRISKQRVYLELP